VSEGGDQVSSRPIIVCTETVSLFPLGRQDNSLLQPRALHTICIQATWIMLPGKLPGIFSIQFLREILDVKQFPFPIPPGRCFPNPCLGTPPGMKRRSCFLKNRCAVTFG